ARTVRLLLGLAADGALRETDAGLVVDRELLSTFPSRQPQPAAPLLRRLPEAALEVLAFIGVCGGADRALVRSCFPTTGEWLSELSSLGLVRDVGSALEPAHPGLAEQALVLLPPSVVGALLDRALTLDALPTLARLRL